MSLRKLMPEARSSERRRVDWGGVLISSVGLIALTYGVIQAGQDGWTDATALGTIVAGAAVLAGLIGWERRLTRGGERPDGSVASGVRPLA